MDGESVSQLTAEVCVCVGVEGSWSSTNPCTPGEAPLSSQRRPQVLGEEEEEVSPPHHVDAHRHPAGGHQRLQDGKTKERGASALRCSA